MRVISNQLFGICIVIFLVTAGCDAYILGDAYSDDGGWPPKVADIRLVAPDTVAYGDTATFKCEIVEKHTDEQIEFEWYIPVGKVLSKYEETSYNTYYTGTKNTITWQAPKDTVNFTLSVDAVSSSDDFVRAMENKGIWVWPAK